MHKIKSRHSLVTLADKYGGIEQASKIARHTDTKITQNIYAHVLEEANSRIADTLGDVLFTQKLKKNAQDDKEDNKEAIAG